MRGRRPTGTWKCRGKQDAGSDRRHSPHIHGAEETRLRISREAARLMAEEGVLDFHAAKRKALARLNLPDGRHLPSNPEIEQALAEHLQLFHARELPQTRQKLRRLALAAMQLLERFEPRLVGSLVSGNVTRFSDIQLHLIADTPELVAFLLAECGIPYEETSTRLRFGADRSETLPAYRFLAEDTTVEVTVFTPTSARETPLSPADGQPMKRMNLKGLQAV